MRTLHFGLPPTRAPSLALGTKPALAFRKINPRFVVIVLRGHVIDALASHADIAFDIAARHFVAGNVLRADNTAGHHKAHRQFVFQAHMPNLALVH